MFTNTFQYKLLFLISFLYVALGAIQALAADLPGSDDYAAVKRFQGSEIVFDKTTEFAELHLALSKIEWDVANYTTKTFESKTLEGKHKKLAYRVPKGASVLEVYRNYEQELKSAGFEILFQARGEELETPSYNNQLGKNIYKITTTYGTPENNIDWLITTCNENDSAYIAAKKPGQNGAGDTYVSAYILANTQKNFFELEEGQAFVRLDVLETKAMENKMVLVKSEEMANQIVQNGKVALYGIQFEHDSAEITASSAGTLEQVAKLLQEKSELSILVVGHTDASGSFEYNRGLSERGAKSVVSWLTQKNIDAKRLFPVGVASASPLASNASEEGKAKNRRVELVDMAGGRP